MKLTYLKGSQKWFICFIGAIYANERTNIHHRINNKIEILKAKNSIKNNGINLND